MIPAAFGYQRPASIEEALRILGSDRDAKVLAGGQSLLPLLKLRLASADTLVDIGRLPGLKGVRRLDDGRIAIGALTTYAELLDSPVKDYGLIGDALPHIGDLQVRNRGTVGGSIAHADPASDMPACLLALDAELVIRSASGERTTGVDGFFEGAFTTGLQAGRDPDRDPAAGSARRCRVCVRLARAARLGLRDGRRGRGRHRRCRPTHLERDCRADRGGGPSLPSHRRRGGSCG